ncbi:MAG: FAD-dependent oxidoreductase [Actinobacteria bacterium]|nr:FAD-dependent oxidoreductase [Actinomycetota bacterium]
MPGPLVLAVEDDAASLAAVAHELRDRYASSYSVVATPSPDEALATLEDAAHDSEGVALVLAGARLPGTAGIDLLEHVRALHPDAKRALLVPWRPSEDSPTAEAILDAMALGRIDYYVRRPAASPDELFHHAITSFLLEWTKVRRSAPHTVHIVGETWSGRANDLRETFKRCAQPHAFCLADSDEGRALLAGAGADAKLPLMLLPDGRVLSDPTNREIAEAAGAPVDLEQDDYDLVIVGAGPAGLSSAVYGASEGLSTLVIDDGGIGGQARSSSLIRNYLGFSSGVSGGSLAEQAYEQAWVFGAKFVFMHEASSISPAGQSLIVTLADGRRVRGRAVVLATGVSYRRLGVAALEALNGAGVHYGGPISEGHAMKGRDAYVVGGANSAGQSALYLARYARRVGLVVRAPSLDAAMSHYLIRAIEATPNVEVMIRTAVVGGGGDGRLQHLVLRDLVSAAERTVPADGLFVLIGARPHTSWLPDAIARDGDGYVLTGQDVAAAARWPLERSPFSHETSLPRVFAAGDVRSGSVKRVASGVGEGSVAIQQVHALFEAAARSADHGSRPDRASAA